MKELRVLFALLVGSNRKYVDPTRAVGVNVLIVFIEVLSKCNNYLETKQRKLCLSWNVIL